MDEQAQVSIKSTCAEFAKLEEALRLKGSVGAESGIDDKMKELLSTVSSNARMAVGEVDQSLKDFYDYFRNLKPIYISDMVRNDLGEEWDVMRKSFARKFTTNQSKSGLDMDMAYQDMSGQWSYLFPADITNETDQFARLVDVLKEYRKQMSGAPAMQEDFQAIQVDVLEKATEAIKNQTREYMKLLDVKKSVDLQDAYANQTDATGFSGLRNIGDEIKSLAEQMKALPEESAFKSIANGIASIKESVSGFDDGFARFCEALASLTASMEAVAKSNAFDTVARKIKKINDIDVSNIGAISDALNQLAESVTNLTNSRINDINLNVPNVTPGTTSTTPPNAPTDNASGVNPASGTTNGMFDVKDAAEQVEVAVGKMKQNVINSLSAMLNSAKSIMAGVGATMQNAASLVTGTAQQIPQAFSNVQGGISSILGNIGGGIGNAFASFTTTATGAASTLVSGVSGVFQTLMPAIGGALSGLSGIVGGALSTAAGVAGSALKGMAVSAKSVAATVSGGLVSALKKATTSIVGLAGKALTGGTGLSSLASTVKNVSQAFSGLEKKLGSVVTMFTRLLLRKAFYAMFKELGTSIDHLAQKSSDFNQKLSELQSACSNFGHQVAALASPLLDVFGGALSKVISMLSTAVSYVNQFLSALTGKSVYTAAKNVATDYAASLGSAADAAKELTNATIGIDELNVISPEDDSSSGGGGGSSDLEDCYEELAINEKLLDLAQQVKDAWANADFTDIGRLIGEKLRTALDSIEWEPIQESARKIGASLATLINGFVETEGLAESVGRTVGQGINTALILAHTFLDSTHWDSIGKFIADGLNEVVKTVNWDMLGETIALYFTSKLELISSAVLGFDWETLGTNFATGFNSFTARMKQSYDEIHWEEMGQSFASGLNSMINGINWEEAGALVGSWFNSKVLIIKGLVEEFDWTTAGMQLATGLNGLINSVGWEDLGVTIGGLFKGALDMISTMIAQFDWKQLGADLATCLGSIDWPGIASSMWDMFSNAVGAAFTLLASFIWTLITDALGSVRDYFAEHVEEAQATGGNIVTGFLSGITDALANIVSWVDEHVVTPFIDAFKNLFGINSPSTVMAEQGGFIIEGLLEGISGAWSSITDFLTPSLEDLQSLFSGAWETIKTTTSGAWDKIKGTFSSAWTNVKSGATSAWTDIKGTFTNSFGDVKTETSSSWSSIEGNFNESLANVLSSTGTELGNIEKSFTESWGNISKTTTDGWNDINTTFSTNWTALTKDVKNKWDEIKKTFTNAWTDIKNEMTTSWDDIIKSFKNNLNSVLETVKNGWKDIKNEFNESWDTIKTQVDDKWKEITDQFSHGMEDSRGSVESGWKNIVESFSEGFDDIDKAVEQHDWEGIGENIVKGIWEGMRDKWDWLEDKVREYAEDLLDEVCDELEIDSPSKKFAEVGYYIVAGLNQGIDRNADSSIDSVTDWVSKLDDVQANIGVKYDVSGADSLSNYVPNYGDGLSSNIIYRTVQDTINSGGALSATLQSSGGLKDAFVEALEDALLPRLENIADNTKKQADKEETTKIYLGSRELTKMVKKQQMTNGYSFSAAT